MIPDLSSLQIYVRPGVTDMRKQVNGLSISERLKHIPEQIYVERHLRLKYACKNCEGSGDEEKPVFRIAPALLLLFSLAASLLQVFWPLSW